MITQLRKTAALALAGLFAVLAFATFAESERQPVAEPDYKSAARYNTEYLKQFTYDQAVTPHWVGKTDRFWYSFRTSSGTAYYLVNPDVATRVPLFDHVKMASQLSELAQKPIEAGGLALTRMTNSDAGDKLTFVVDDFLFEYDLQGEKLAKLGKAPPEPVGQGRGGRGGGRGQFQQQDDQRQQQDEQEQRQQDDIQQQDEQLGQTNRQQTVTQQTGEQQTGGRRGGRGGRGGGGRRGGGPGGGRNGDYRNFSPDKTAYVFVRSNNLFYVEVPKPVENTNSAAKPDDEKKDPAKTVEGDSKEASKDIAKDSTKDATTKPASSENADKDKAPAPTPDPDANAIQLTSDGTEDYSFGGGMNGFGGGGRGGTNTFRPPPRADGKSRANVTWSTNSQAFCVQRRDSRGVQNLYLVNSLSTPRPTLVTYKYAMPGEEAIRKSELYYFTRATKKLILVKPKWKDEGYSDTGFDQKSTKLHFIHTDRLLRHAELCSLDLATGECKCLIPEGFENAYLTTQPVHYLDETDEFIWWSERSGWGHFYLYDHNGKVKNAITSGAFRASRVAEVDTTNRVLYFTATGREPGEDLNLEHLYSVRFDGGGLTLMDPGNANHTSVLSPSRKFLVDNRSRVDLPPASFLRAADGKEIMPLEKADMSKLTEVGWKAPETFVVKAADGVTDLFGNMWKPFNFDQTRKYPIIVHVYPGPQMEGTSHTFSATGSEQQLAQLGFVVIQVGHRGGTPSRSKAYATFGYFNMRDYPLADTKTAVEQLAARFPYVDLDRVGIYGHSGGGFFTAAAMLQKPYNEFFKVGVAESGNHDNNIYNNGWAERYNGLKEVEVKESQTNSTSGVRNVTSAGAEGNRRAESDPERLDGGQQDEVNDDDALTMLGIEDEVPQTAQKTDAGKGDDQGQSSKKSDDHAVTEKQDEGKKDDAKTDAAPEKKTKFEIHVATNAELAPNLKGHLLLIHGDMDNNVHPANTLRLVEALIKANKRFDMLILPGKPHAYGDMAPYTTQRTWEYFSEYLLNDHPLGADIYDRTGEMPK